MCTYKRCIYASQKERQKQKTNVFPFFFFFFFFFFFYRYFLQLRHMQSLFFLLHFFFFRFFRSVINDHAYAFSRSLNRTDHRFHNFSFSFSFFFFSFFSFFFFSRSYRISFLVCQSDLRTRGIKRERKFTRTRRDLPQSRDKSILPQQCHSGLMQCKKRVRHRKEKRERKKKERKETETATSHRCARRMHCNLPAVISCFFFLFFARKNDRERG